MFHRSISTVLLYALLSTTSHAFAPSPSFHAVSSKRSTISSNVKPSSLFSTAEELIPDENRRAELFQHLLRDLQIEGVPLLGCDADQVHTLNAAAWTTMADMSEEDSAQRACLVMERIPMDALRAFVDDFTVLKTQKRLMNHLPELSRLSVSLIGKGAGPALLIESGERTAEEKSEHMGRLAAASVYEESKVTAALRSFVDRVVIGCKACPYITTADLAGSGLEAKGVIPGPIGYRYSGTSDVCMALATFWNCICELLGTPEAELSSTVLSLPGIGPGKDKAAHDRFAAVVELVGRNLCLFRGDGVFGLVHFHPAYTREDIFLPDKPSYGHLPPQSWIRPMLRMNGNVEEADSLTEDDIALSDYQRRAPHTMINILRASQLGAAVGGKSIVDLDLGDGVTEKASGISTYSRNAIRLAKEGKESLQSALDQEIAMQ
uniref:Uncharacterized protein n=2 Tax=Ditylum brightwellii TaxID=49249 RepID=A0A7S4SP73_9STRA